MRPMMKTLLMLGATAAGALGVSYLASPRARDLRARLQGAYEVLKSAVIPAPRADVAPQAHAEPTPSPAEAATEVALHLEHALEHGPAGRARSEEQSRRPNVRMHAVRHS